MATAVFVLAACAGTSQERAGEEDSSPDPVMSDTFEEALPRPTATDEALDPEVSFHLLTAERLLGMGEYDDALEQFMAAAHLSGEAELAAQAARVAVRLEKWPQALIAVERWLELAPASQDARQIRILAWINTGEIDRAVDALSTLIDSGDSRDRSWRTAAMLIGAADDNEHGLEVMEGLSSRYESSGESAMVAHIQSIVLWQAGDPAGALERALDAAQRSGEREHRVWAAQLAAANERLELALSLYRQAREDEPEDAALVLAEAEVLRQLDRRESALEVLEGFDSDSEVLYTRGIYLVEAERRDEALEAYQRLVKLEPEDPARHAYLAGRLAELLERDAEAGEWYRRVEEGPNQERARLRRAVIAGRGGNLETARELLAGVRSEGGEEMVGEAWVIEAELLREAGRPEESIDLLGQALQTSPNEIPLLYSRALSAVEADNLDLAEQDLRRIIQMDGDNAMALNSLGYTLADRTDRLREAYRLIERALELEPDDPAILDSMGWVLYRMGRPEKALPYLREALEGDDNPEIAAHLIEVLWNLGRREEANEILEYAWENHSGDDYLSRTLERLGLNR